MEKRGWGLNYSPTVKDLINHAYIMKTPEKFPKYGVLRASSW